MKSVFFKEPEGYSVNIGQTDSVVKISGLIVGYALNRNGGVTGVDPFSPIRVRNAIKTLAGDFGLDWLPEPNMSNTRETPNEYRVDFEQKPETIELKVQKWQLGSYQKRAKAAGVSLDVWVIGTLDDAVAKETDDET